MKRKTYALIIMVCLCAITGCGKQENPKITEVQTTEMMTTVMAEETEELTTEVTTEITTEAVNPRADVLIAIDPGHQSPLVDMSDTEPNAPDSDVMKMKATTGTTGKYTGVPEYELNLTISKKLKEALVREGYNVIMTREDNDTAISNCERATLANEAGADVSIRIHANGSDDNSTNGALVLIGSENNAYVGNLYADSERLGECVLNAYCKSTGMKNLGIQTNDTMTGINWSQIPVIILEMGFMSNEQDDRNMQELDYQTAMVNGMVQGIEAYFGFDEKENLTPQDSELSDLQEEIQTMANSRTVQGDSVSIYVENLETGQYAEVNSQKLRAASLIKLYIAGCLYEEMENTTNQDFGDVEELVSKMITISDNDAANTLVRKLGNGDALAGMEKVNQFCANHGLTDSHMGRLMLDFSSSEENYTSVKDSAAFLRSLYYNRLAGSEKMLTYLKQQERTGKLPAGVPEGVETANKTGELDNVENDVALVFAEGHPYVISVMADNLSDTAAAREWIVELSEMVYEYFER